MKVELGFGLYGFNVAKFFDERGCTEKLPVEDFESIMKFPKQALFVTNILENTLRGLHFQGNSGNESKLVYCMQGRIFDVAVNIANPEISVSLEIGEGCEFMGVFIPAGFAHGYLTSTPNTFISYLIDTPYDEASSKGYRWDDPALGIKWPNVPRVISQRDTSYPFLKI